MDGTLQQRAVRMELLAHAIAVLPYQSLDGPLYAIHLVANQVPMLGTIALQGIDELVRQNDGDGVHEMDVSVVVGASADGRDFASTELVEVGDKERKVAEKAEAEAQRPFSGQGHRLGE